MLNGFRLAFPATLCAVLTCTLPSQTFAQLPNSITIGGQAVKLNGSGTRTKAFVSIYESGLYLRQPSADAGAILQADELMAIRVQILSGFVSRSSLVASLQDGLKQSTGGNTATIAQETDLFVKSLQEEVKKNDVYDFVYVPQKGTFILKNGKVKGTVPGLAFKQAFFGIWLSDQPVDAGLRSAMLSSSTRR